jgi:hypothetical protein
VPSVVPYVFVSFQPLSIYYSNYTLVEATSQQLFFGGARWTRTISTGL